MNMSSEPPNQQGILLPDAKTIQGYIEAWKAFKNFFDEDIKRADTQQSQETETENVVEYKPTDNFDITNYNSDNNNVRSLFETHKFDEIKDMFEDFIRLFLAFVRKYAVEKHPQLYDFIKAQTERFMTKEKQFDLKLLQEHVKLFIELCKVHQWTLQLESSEISEMFKSKLPELQPTIIEVYNRIYGETNSMLVKDVINPILIYQVDRVPNASSILVDMVYELGLCIFNRFMEESKWDSVCNGLLASKIARQVGEQEKTILKAPEFYIVEVAGKYLEKLKINFNTYFIDKPDVTINTNKQVFRIFVFVYDFIQYKNTLALIAASLTQYMYINQTELKIEFNENSKPQPKTISTIINNMNSLFGNMKRILGLSIRSDGLTELTRLFPVNFNAILKQIEPYVTKINRFVEISKNYKELLDKRSMKTISGDGATVSIDINARTELKTSITKMLMDSNENLMGNGSYNLAFLDRFLKFYYSFSKLQQQNQSPIDKSPIQQTASPFDVEYLANNFSDIMGNLKNIHELQSMFSSTPTSGEDPSKILENMSQLIAENDEDKLILNFVKNDDLYILLVQTYEDMSKAVRVIIKVRDDHLVQSEYDARVIVANGFPTDKHGVDQMNESRLDNLEWYFTDNKLRLRDQYVDIASDDDKLILDKQYGAFFKVVPPFVYQPHFQANQRSPLVRINNELIAKRYVKVDGLASLLCSKTVPLNLVMMTYGYSGSGKTFTLFGSLATSDKVQRQDGILTHLINAIYDNQGTMVLNKIHTLYGKLINRGSKFELDEVHNPNAFRQEVQEVNEHANDGIMFSNAIKHTMHNLVERNNIQYIFDYCLKCKMDILRDSSMTDKDKNMRYIQTLIAKNYSDVNRFGNYCLSAFIGFLISKKNEDTLLSKITYQTIFDYLYLARCDVYDLMSSIEKLIIDISALGSELKSLEEQAMKTRQQLKHKIGNIEVEKNGLPKPIGTASKADQKKREAIDLLNMELKKLQEDLNIIDRSIYEQLKKTLAKINDMLYNTKLFQESLFQYYQNRESKTQFTSVQMLFVKANSKELNNNQKYSYVKQYFKYLQEFQADLHLDLEECKKTLANTYYKFPAKDDDISQFESHCKFVYGDVYSRDIFKGYQRVVQTYDQLIKSTPNNIHSSRGFIMFEFIVKTQHHDNKLVIVDMAGNEDPYDIIMKTMPTLKIKSSKPQQDNDDLHRIMKTGADFDYAKSELIVETITKKIESEFTSMIKKVILILSQVNAVNQLKNDVVQTLRTFLFGGLAKQSEKYDKIEDYLNHDTSLFDVMKEYFGSNGSKHAASYTHFFSVGKLYFFKGLLTKIKRFTNELQVLNKGYYTLLMFLIQFAFTHDNFNKVVDVSTIYIGDENKFTGQAVLSKLFDMITTLFRQNMQSSDVKKISINNIGQWLKNAFQADLTNQLKDTRSFDVFTYDERTSSINMKFDKLSYTTITLYYLLCSDNEYNIVAKDEEIKGYLHKEDLGSADLLNLYQIVQEKIDKFDLLPDTQANITEEYSRFRYIIQLLLTYDDVSSINSVSQETKLFNLYHNFQIKSANNRVGQLILIKSDENFQDIIGRSVSNIVRDLFMDVMILNNDKPSLITANVDYFKAIVMEGFYINQVNFELMKFLAKAKDISTRSINNDIDAVYVDKLSNAIVQQDTASRRRLLYGANGYNPRKSINDFVGEDDFPVCMTSIRNILAGILQHDETLADGTKTTKYEFGKTKWFMIANIRPDIKRYRQGAYNTLELIKELKST